MRISSLLLCCAKNDKPVHVVLRGQCLSVDEPIQGSTAALAILGSLVTPTPEVLVEHWRCWHYCSFRQLQTMEYLL